MADKFVNQFMAEKAGMAEVDRSEVYKKVQELSKGSRKQEFEREMEEKREHELQQMRTRIHTYHHNTEKQSIQRDVKHRLEEVEKYRDLTRIWAHFDFDMFYVACELLDRPDLVDKPCAVGSPEGVLCTANYVARKFGVRSAQPTFMAKSICPYLVLIPPNFEKYRKYSDIFRKILSEFDENYESLGLDEAYVDLTDHLRDKSIPETAEFVRGIRMRIQAETKLTVSCGVGANKMLCKMASEQKKPNDQFLLPNDKEAILRFLKEKPIRKIPGIGPVNEFFLKGIGITTGGELLQKMDIVSLCFSENSTEGFMFSALGISRNIHEFKERKSVGRSDTFRATNEEKFWLDLLDKLCERVAEDMKELELVAKTVTLSFQTQNFEKHDKSITLDTYICEKKDLLDTATKMLNKEVKYGTKLRLLGVRCTHLLNAEDNKKNTLHAYLNKTMAARKLPPKQNGPIQQEKIEVEGQPVDGRPTSERSESVSVQRDFECPVCSNTIECRGNYSKFERHLNKCLQGPSEQNPSAIIREEEDIQIRAIRSPTPPQPKKKQPPSKPATEAGRPPKKQAERQASTDRPKPPKQTNMLSFLKK